MEKRAKKKTVPSPEHPLSGEFTIRRILWEHFKDTLFLLLCEVILYIAISIVGIVPAVPPQFVDRSKTVIEWIFYATLGLLGVDSLVQIAVRWWRRFPPKRGSG